MISSALAFLAMQSPHVATTPASRLSEQWWAQRHEQSVKLTQQPADVAFQGDSITQGWEGEGKASWDKLGQKWKLANYGFSGDRTEHVLWRLENGELIGQNPKVIVIMIGTNNVGHGSSNPDQTADGVKAIVAKLLSGCPRSKIALLGIFPRGEQPNDPLRLKVAEATSKFRTIADDKRVFFFDVGKHFVRADGTLRTYLMPDHLHLNSAGYEIWAKAIEPILENLTA